MSTSFQEARTIELGYRIRRANLEACGGLMIFPHDLETFCIQQLYDCDHQSLVFYHERTGSLFIKGEFSLEAAIEFVWLESKVRKSLAIRWCMMMEYVSYEDQRSDEQRKLLAQNENAKEAVEMAGGVDDG